ncbi:flavin reductase [Pseudohoeflea coraliihabitans]|uniref:Flavin reductase n=1 Tax=Pseudohoeflea coraliihabitans TaxID=2860393 RepID=A0ABS6WIR4_9HYPH|nr:flavin reductase [Pseudohoeflea sp. DP4N28-3]MBW3095826.1 flavin reductase [Pseudohoeflea sp. DP4N28-3]
MTSSFDPRALRDAFGAFITGVTIVTAYGPDGQPLGFTANSFSSVSLDPPLLLICLAKTSSNFEAITTASGFAVNILAETQQALSNTFARRVPDRFADVAWQDGPNGSPIFPEAAAWFDCERHQCVDAGDHVILIGRVAAFENNGHNGLGYARGSYFTPALATEAIAAAASATTGKDATRIAAIVERDGAILLVERGNSVWGLPGCAAAGGDPVGALSRQITEDTGLNVEIGFLFSVYEERPRGCQHIVYRAHALPGTPKSGAFHTLADLPFDQLDTPQTADMLRRFRAESALGQFAIYFGNETAGRVHRLSKEA